MYAKHIPQYLAHKEGWINARNYGCSQLGGLPETARPSFQGSHGRERRPRAPPTISLPNARSMGAFAPGLSPSSQLPRKAGVHISPSAPLLGPRDVTLVAQRDRRKPEAPAQALLGGRGTPGRRRVDRVPRAGLRRRCAGAGTTAMPFAGGVSRPVVSRPGSHGHGGWAEANGPGVSASWSSRPRRLPSPGVGGKMTCF